MSAYGDCLKRYIKDKRVSVRKLSMETKIDRTLIQKYLSGDRLPKNIDEVNQISDCLMLSPEKKEELVRQYNKSYYGDKQYEGFLMIRDILNGLVDYQFNPGVLQGGKRGECSGLEQRKECRIYLGALEVENALRFMLREQMRLCRMKYQDAALSEEEQKIRILAQPDVANLLKTVLSVCIGHKMEVEQIVCLDEDSAEGNNNIRIIYNLLPMLFGNVNYQSFYYYDNKEAHINTMSLLPVLILAGDNGMICNSKMNEGLLFQNGETAAFYRRQYDAIKRKTRLFTGYLEDITEWMTFLKGVVTELAVAEICIGDTPCVTYCLDEKMLDRYLKVGEKEKQYVKDTLSENRNKVTGIAESGGMTNIFSEDGLRSFMETGRSSEYPEEYYRPIEESDRLLILERVICMMETGQVKYCMTNPIYLKLDERLSIYINEKVVFQYHQSHCLGQYFCISEVSIRRSFEEFVKFAGENRWIYDSHETLIRMKKILIEYKDKFLQ